MEGKYTKKLEQQQATSMEVIDTQKTLDGRDRQIEVANDAAAAAQATANAALAVANRAHNFDLPYNPSGTGNVALTAAYELARTAHISHPNDAIGNSAIYNVQLAANQAQISANQGINQAAVASNQAGNALAVGQNAQQAANQADNHAQQAQNAANSADNHAQQAQQTANSADKAAAAASKAASAAAQVAKTAALSGASRHTHSQTPYVMYSEEVRLAMLSVREGVQSLACKSESKEVRALAGAVEILFKLQMDYRDMDAFERERRLGDPEWSEWSGRYKETFGMDEHSEEAREHYQHSSTGDYKMDPYEGIAPVS